MAPGNFEAYTPGFKSLPLEIGACGYLCKLVYSKDDMKFLLKEDPESAKEGTIRVTSHLTFLANMDRGVVETYFSIMKVSWKCKTFYFLKYFCD